MLSRAELVYLKNGQKRRFHLKEAVSAEGVALEIDNCAGQFKWGQLLSINLYNREPFELLDFKLELTPGLADTEAMMVNGFQSWSRSGQLCAGERIVSPPRVTYPIFAAYGDYRFYRYSGRRGRLHSWTYTYFTFPDGQVLFLGSLDESAGYTLFEYDYARDRLLIRRDCAGAAAPAGYPLLRLYLGRGNPDQVLEEYFGRFKTDRGQAPRLTGWTSWYNYYTGITEEIIKKNAVELSRRELPLDLFQIDDGWQEAIGDWLQPNHKFPAGMKALADFLREHGFRPGLWLAPFICERRSSIYREHPEWLLRNKRGKPVKAGYNPLWSGWFYALDFYAPGFQDHLGRLLATVQEEWGFEMLKFDFLYAAALLPRQGKPRGEVMGEVMDFLHRHCPASKLLGCGVPLGPAMGRVDYCRIGGDVAPYWEMPFNGLNYRERVSTANSLVSTIGRSHLDRLTFRNDPDVFILRDGVPRVNQNRLTPHQRYTLFFLNNLFGGLVFFSDNVDGYTKEQLRTLRSSFPSLETSVDHVSEQNGIYRFEFAVNRRRYLAFTNFTASRCSIPLEGDGPCFNPALFALKPGHRFVLEPFQTICFYRIEPRDDKAYLLGATDHLYPGAQVEKLIVRSRSATLQLHKHASPHTKIFLAVPRGVIVLPVNKVNYAVTLKDRVHFITIPHRQ